MHSTVPTPAAHGTDDNHAMPFEDAVKKAFGLEGEVWLRHANPWSVYTLIPIPVLLVAAVWSRQWIGWWCLVAAGADVSASGSPP